MDANLTSLLHTIQMTSIATYLQKLHNYLPIYPEDSNNSFVIINSFSGKIDKSALQIFALPALFNYVRENHRRILMNQVDQHWTLIFDLFFAKLHNSFDSVRFVLNRDPKYQYHLALFHFKNWTTLAKEIVSENCGTNNSRLEEETLSYVNNPNNYTCPNNGKLSSLKVIYNRKRNYFLQKYDEFVRAVDEEDEKNSAKITRGRFRINGQLFIVCNASELVRKNEICGKEGIKVSGKKRIGLFFKEKNLTNFKDGKNRLKCLPLLYACIVGIIEGNPINSSNTCPIKEAIRFKDVMGWSIVYAQFTNSETRSVLSHFGTSLRTMALMSSMEMALNNYYLKNNNSNAKTNLIKEVNFPKFPVVDDGCEIAASVGNELKSVEDLLKTIEDKFFIPYESNVRNFSVKLNVEEKRYKQ